MATDAISKTAEGQTVRNKQVTGPPERFIRPSVNIIESDEGLTVFADIPGAKKELLELNMEQGIMTINAPVQYDPQGRKIHTEFELAPYYRQFTLPDSFDHEKATADMSHGRLTVHIPRTQTAKPRKIEIAAS
jgi:HSP20 family molecular chaperone IbpA